MSPTEVTQVLTAIADIHTTMNEGFGKVYIKIDEKFDECDDRLTDVETDIKVKNAVAGIKKETKDFWKWVIRSWVVLSGISLFGIAVKLFIFGAKL